MLGSYPTNYVLDFGEQLILMPPSYESCAACVNHVIVNPFRRSGRDAKAIFYSNLQLKLEFCLHRNTRAGLVIEIGACAKRQFFCLAKKIKR